MEYELKRCPLCGHEAELITTDEHYYYVKCTCCVAKSVSITKIGDYSPRYESSAVVAWNNGLIFFNGDSIAEVLALKDIQNELQQMTLELTTTPSMENEKAKEWQERFERSFKKSKLYKVLMENENK